LNGSCVDKDKEKNPISSNSQLIYVYLQRIIGSIATESCCSLS